MLMARMLPSQTVAIACAALLCKETAKSPTSRHHMPHARARVLQMLMMSYTILVRDLAAKAVKRRRESPPVFFLSVNELGSARGCACAFAWIQSLAAAPNSDRLAKAA